MNRFSPLKCLTHTAGQAAAVLLIQLLFVSLGDALMRVVYWDILLCACLALLARQGLIDVRLPVGVLSVVFNLLADPGSGYGFCVWFSLIPCFHLVSKCPSLGTALAFGQWVGTLLALGVFSWLWDAMRIFWEIPFLPTFSLLLGATIGLGFQYAAFFLFTKFLSDRTLLGVGFTGALVYTLTEFWMPLPFPMNLALAFTWTPALIQVADLAGMVGVSFAIALVGGGLYELGMALLAKRVRMAAISFSTIVGVLVLQVGYGAHCLKKFAPTEDSESLEVAMIQPMAPLKVLNSDLETKKKFARILVDLSEEVVTKGGESPDLLIWPEGAGPFAYRSPNFNPEYLEKLKPFQKKHPTPMLIQDVVFQRETVTNRVRYTSTSTLIDGSGEVVDAYAKHFLLPFGEYLPGEKTFPFLKKLFPETRSIKAGNRQNLLNGPGGPIVPLICYEILFPDYVRSFCERGGRYIVNQTNDRWYGPKQQPLQHLSFAVFRAVENRIPLVRSTNSGISALVDPRGVIEPEHRTGSMERTTLRGVIHPRIGGSIYADYGDILPLWIMTPLFLVLFARGVLHGRSRETR